MMEKTCLTLPRTSSVRSVFAKIALVAVILATSLACLGSLSGCASPSPTETTQNFLEGIKANDQDAYKDIYAGDPGAIFSSVAQEAASEESEEGITSQQIQDSIQNDLVPKLREFDYELSNEQVNGDTATVEVKITTYAAGDAFNSFLSDYMSQAFTLAFSGATQEDLEELAASIFTSKIKSMDKSYSDTVTLSLTKVDNTWKVDELTKDSEMTDALLGGILSAISSMSSAYGSASSE